MEVQGDVFNRDEEKVLQHVKKTQQEEMKLALQRQIIEKQRLKDEEKQKRLEQEKLDNQRIQVELEKEGLSPTLSITKKKFVDPQFLQSPDSPTLMLNNIDNLNDDAGL